MLFDHPVVERNYWTAFTSHLNPYFSRAIGREQMDLPYWLNPLALGVIVNSPALLLRTRYAGPPLGWTQLSPAVYQRAIGKVRFRVRHTNDGRLWLISRWPSGVSMGTDRNSETIVHQFGHTPLLADNPLAAMHFAEWFHENERNGMIGGLCWCKASLNPQALCAAIALADERARSEGLTISWNDLWASSAHSRRMKTGRASYHNGKLRLPDLVRMALSPGFRAW